VPHKDRPRRGNLCLGAPGIFSFIPGDPLPGQPPTHAKWHADFFENREFFDNFIKNENYLNNKNTFNNENYA
jgi:hypothetical protein